MPIACDCLSTAFSVTRITYDNPNIEDSIELRCIHCGKRLKLE